ELAMERLFVWLVRRLPARVRDRHEAEMRRTFRQKVSAAYAAGGPRAAWAVSARECRDALRAVVASRMGRDPLAEGTRAAGGRTAGGRQMLRSILQDVRFSFR